MEHPAIDMGQASLQSRQEESEVEFLIGHRKLTQNLLLHFKLQQSKWLSSGVGWGGVKGRGRTGER